jgi:hypothetical protein
MSMRRGLKMAVTVSIAAVALTCKDSTSGDSGPVAGWVAIDMTTPNGDDGGIMFLVAGGAVDSVRSSYPNVLSRAESATSMRIVVAGNLTAGKIADIWVPDARNVSEYSATPVETAARGTFAQRATTGYSLKLTRVQ